MLNYIVRNMYLFQHRFLFLILLCIFVTITKGNNNLTNIREKGSSDNITSNLTVSQVNNANLLINTTQTAASLRTPILPKTNNVSSTQAKVVSEGGIISSTVETHNGRENVIENPSKVMTNKAVVESNSTLRKPADIKPVTQQDDGKLSVPKKGVNFTDSDIQSKPSANITSETSLTVSSLPTVSSSNINKKMSSITLNHTASMNTTIKHKKPIVTESDQDYINMSKSNEKTSKENPITIDQMDPLLADKKSKRSDYIVPIVAVILSVPLVAILISILYKRGTDWWQHRNYKRMDFLIEGMYHN